MYQKSYKKYCEVKDFEEKQENFSLKLLIKRDYLFKKLIELSMR